MDVLLSAEEREAKGAVRAVLERYSQPAIVHESELTQGGYAPELWHRFCELGWTSLAVPARYDGSGLSIAYAGLVAEEVGRYISPIPYATTAAAAHVISCFGGPKICARLLPGISAQADILTYAVRESGPLFDPGSTQMLAAVQGDEIVLNGTKLFVENFTIARACIVACRTPQGGMTLVVVDPRADGITVTPLVTTAKDNQCHVTFTDVRVPLDSVLGDIGAGAAALAVLVDCGAVLIAAQMAGAARRAMELAAEYAKIRNAFDHPIGAFQAIQHMSADMLIWVDGAELLSREALWWIGETNAPCLEASQAKAFANDRMVTTCRYSQQIHGGIGFTAEFDLNLWYRRVASWAGRMGNSRQHRARIAAGLLDQPGTVRLDAMPAAPNWAAL